MANIVHFLVVLLHLFDFEIVKNRMSNLQLSFVYNGIYSRMYGRIYS